MVDVPAIIALTCELRVLSTLAIAQFFKWVLKKAGSGVIICATCLFRRTFQVEKQPDYLCKQALSRCLDFIQDREVAMPP